MTLTAAYAGGCRLPDLLALELFVVLEESFQNEQSVRRQFVGFDVAVEFGIVVATAMTLSSLAPESIIVIKPMARALMSASG